MKIEDVITLSDNKEYVILDIVKLNKDDYLYCVGIDKDEMPTKEYRYLKASYENEEYYVEDIADQKILETVIAMFAANYLNESNESANN